MGNTEGACKPFQSPRQVNAHDVKDLVCIDDIIDYTIINHEVYTSTLMTTTRILEMMVIMRYLHAWQGKDLLKMTSVKFLRQKDRLIRARIDKQTKAR
jgi:hypothetical protein